MFGIGETEFAIILIFAFLLFGPDKMPAMGRTIGRALRQFREAQDSVTKVVQAEIVDPINKAADEPVATSKHKAAADDDADIDEAEAGSAATRKAETFAERRARLAAAASASDEPGERADDDAAGQADAVGSEAVGSEAVAPKPKAARKTKRKAVSAKPSAAALYGLEDEPAPSAAPDEAEPPATPDKPSTDGKGEGTTEA
ncbi:MAG: twin-arginine translocase TatA/TatE family subunit [Atopobiaceae bacterium]|nr:twin-arginine translocase TatA/TatE family subunit [Atopobiaceae bacterium]